MRRWCAFFWMGVCVSGWSSSLSSPRLGMRRLVATSSSEEGDSSPLVMAPFEADEYPTSGEELIEMYQRWSASRGEALTFEEAKRDVQCFMSDEETSSKWRPILQAAAKEKNKYTPIQLINTFTAYAVPVAVGLVILPLIRSIGEQVPFVNDVVIPQIDGGIDMVKKGVQKAIELPICLEFGDC